MEVAKDGLDILSTFLNAAPIPEPFKSAVTAIPDIALQILTIVETVKGNAEDAKALAIYIANVTKTTMRPFETKPQGSLDNSPAMKKRIDDFREVLEKIKDEMQALTSRRLRLRVLHYARDAATLTAFKTRVDEAVKDIQLETVMATGHEVDLISQGQERIFQEQYRVSQELLVVTQRQQDAVIDRLIDRLGNADSGAAKKPPCLAGTRSAILTRITGWIEESISHGFCLSGQAGTGKSSIAASIAKREKASERLGAVFHFTRDDQARNKAAILVIARQLAFWQSGRLRSAIASAIEKDLDIAQMAPSDQFEKLILDPLQYLGSTDPTLVVILDAMDECDQTYASLLLKLIGKAFGDLPSAVKFFITTRGEPWLQSHYDREPMKSHLEIFSLGDEKKEDVENDIEAFLKAELPELVESLVEDASDWPGEEKRKALAHKSQGLFIFASTAVRIITDFDVRDPDEELDRLLSSDHHSHLDGIYGQILERACPKTINPKVVKLFRDVIGALVVSREPINIHTLASLLCPNGTQLQSFISVVRLKVLNYLQAVLVIPGVNAIEQAANAQPIQFIHTSFVDYLTDATRCESLLLVQLSEQHERLAAACFRAMESLKRNICDLDSSLLNSEVKDLDERIRERIPPALQYACVHIATHVSQSAEGNQDMHSLVVKFAKERLIYWLEGLSLMGRAHQGVTMVTSIEKWFKAPTAELTLVTLNALSTQSITAEPLESDDVTSALLSDLRRFIMEFIEPIATSTPHIYSSALLLMPSETELSRQYGYLADSHIKVIRGCVKEWSRALWTANKHSNGLSCIAISPDGTIIVSGSIDYTLRMWDARTGVAIGGALESHTSTLTCLALSPDGTTIVSGSYDCTLRMWDARTGVAIGEAMEATSLVSCVAISPDGRAIVSGYHDNTLQLWDARTGVAIGEAIKGHTGSVKCVAISPDGTTIVSGSGDDTLQRWDARTGVVIGDAMEGHTDRVTCVAISPDGTTIISGSDDCTLRLWDARTGEAIGGAMEGHKDCVNCIAISPDGTMIVSGSDDNTLQLWDSRTGVVIGKRIKCHTDPVMDAAFSNDGKHIISISSDNETLLWDHINQTVLSDMMLEEVLSSMPRDIFELDEGGWVRHSGDRRIFWVSIDLRADLVFRCNIMTLAAQKLPIFDVSAYVA